MDQSVHTGLWMDWSKSICSNMQLTDFFFCSQLTNFRQGTSLWTHLDSASSKRQCHPLFRYDPCLSLRPPDVGYFVLYYSPTESRPSSTGCFVPPTPGLAAELGQRSLHPSTTIEDGCRLEKTHKISTEKVPTTDYYCDSPYCCIYLCRFVFIPFHSLYR